MRHSQAVVSAYDGLKNIGVSIINVCACVSIVRLFFCCPRMYISVHLPNILAFSSSKYSRMHVFVAHEGAYICTFTRADETQIFLRVFFPPNGFTSHSSSCALLQMLNNAFVYRHYHRCANVYVSVQASLATAQLGVIFPIHFI